MSKAQLNHLHKIGRALAQIATLCLAEFEERDESYTALLRSGLFGVMMPLPSSEAPSRPASATRARAVRAVRAEPLRGYRGHDDDDGGSGPDPKR